MTRTEHQKTPADLYLRMSDLRGEDTFEAREAKLRGLAARLGWDVGRVVVENDLTVTRNGNGRSRPASAFKRKRIVTPSGRTELRTVRPGFRAVLDDLMTGRAGAVLAEDLDRACRDPRDLEDLIDAAAARGASARSISGSLTLTAGGTDAEVTMARMMVAVGNKESRDKVRRVAEQRQRTAENGAYHGGPRPFGYRHDPDAPKYHKTLIVVEPEAAEIRAAAVAVLARAGDPDAGDSLRGIARSLRDRGVPTVTGAKWSAELLREVLRKPAVAGLAVHKRSATGDNPDGLHPAGWPAILTRDDWETLREILRDPGRRTSHANAPRWLGTGIYLCGPCQAPSLTARGGPGRRPGYVCRNGAHLRRNAAATDAYVGMHVVERLNRDDAADLLRPAPRPGTDVAALRAEQKRIEAARDSRARLHAAGDLTDDDLVAASRYARQRLAEIRDQLDTSGEPDPLAEFRGQPDAQRVWDGLPLERKRAVLRALAVVTLLPAARRGRGFDPDSVRVEPKR
jgi:site-specific DNA recombinase